MELIVLIGQRKERYEGEYALEALAVIDAIGDDDNPEYMQEQLQKLRSSGDFDALAPIRLTVSEKAVREILYPSRTPLPAAIAQEPTNAQG